MGFGERIIDASTGTTKTSEAGDAKMMTCDFGSGRRESEFVRSPNGRRRITFGIPRHRQSLPFGSRARILPTSCVPLGPHNAQKDWRAFRNPIFSNGRAESAKDLVVCSIHRVNLTNENSLSVCPPSSLSESRIETLSRRAVDSTSRFVEPKYANRNRRQRRLPSGSK